MIGGESGENGVALRDDEGEAVGGAGHRHVQVAPPAGRLVGGADATNLPTDDFNAMSRNPQLDIGAYRSNASGNPGWPLQVGFKTFDPVFANGFEML